LLLFCLFCSRFLWFGLVWGFFECFSIRNFSLIS
jgi:hypothetical protein